MSFLGKVFKIYKKENCENYLKFLGVPDDKIVDAFSFDPTEKFVKDGDTYTYYTQTQKGPIEASFKSGTEIDYTFLEEPAKTTFVIDGNTVMQTLKTDKNVLLAKREYNGDELVLTLSADGFNGVAKIFGRFDRS